MICKFMFRKLKDVMSEIYGDGDDEEEPNAMVDEVLPEISAKRFAVCHSKTFATRTSSCNDLCAHALT